MQMQRQDLIICYPDIDIQMIFMLMQGVNKEWRLSTGHQELLETI